MVPQWFQVVLCRATVLDFTLQALQIIVLVLSYLKAPEIDIFKQ